jgi:hypothetical protein
MKKRSNNGFVLALVLILVFTLLASKMDSAPSGLLVSGNTCPGKEKSVEVCEDLGPSAYCECTQPTGEKVYLDSPTPGSLGGCDSLPGWSSGACIEVIPRGIPQPGDTWEDNFRDICQIAENHVANQVLECDSGCEWVASTGNNEPQRVEGIGWSSDCCNINYEIFCSPIEINK